MRKALVLSLSNLQHDARVTRQVGFLAADFEVTLAAFGPGRAAHHHFIPLTAPRLTLWRKFSIAAFSLLGLYRKAWTTWHDYQRFELQLIAPWDLIVANDAETLPLAFRIRGTSDARVVFDAHEYAPRHFEDRPVWRLIFQPINNWICRTFIPQAAAVFTVGKGLADEYARHFPCRPVIITNAPAFRSLEPVPPSGTRIRLVHHGIANPSRRLELLHTLMEHLNDRFSLDLYLVTSDQASKGTRGYIEQLKTQFGSHPRIRVHPPVPGHELVDVLHQYDAGIFLLPPENFNYANTLPNKLFDFIQARLAVIVGPSPEMAEVVRRYDLGVVGGSFDPVALAAQLTQLTPERLRHHKECARIAAQECCAEKNELVFRKTIEDAMGKNRR